MRREVAPGIEIDDDPERVDIADVYVRAELRGRGLGKVLVAETIEGGPFADCRWLLHTREAHELYRRLGFSEPDDPTLMERPARGAIRRSPEAS